MTTDGHGDRPVERLQYGFVPLTQPGRPPGRAEIEALEAMGATSLWAPGHVASGRPVPEAVVGAARLAALSERATVGTAVLLAPLYHPVIVAKQFAELDVATGRADGARSWRRWRVPVGVPSLPDTDRGSRCPRRRGDHDHQASVVGGWHR